MRRNLAGLVLLPLLLGCAEVVSVPATEADARGFIYYEPEPYILLTYTTTKVEQPNGAKVESRAPKAEVVYFKNPKKRRAIVARGGMGNVTFSPTLAGGWNLTGINATVDSQVDENVKALSDLFSKVATAGVFMTPGTATPAAELPEGLYRVRFDDDSGLIAGFCMVWPQNQC